MSSTVQQEKAKQRREKFAALLRDMFQLDQPELDFGLYRIMHARKDDINRFIEQDLPSIAQDAFKDFSSQDKAQLEQEIANARQAAAAAGFNPDESPKVKELEAQYQSGFDIAREEGEVYDALVTFFSRYYDEGDFVSRRVYKDGTYAIPYQGEEVVLHWANKDQYYIKSSETLRDYTFRLNPNATESEEPQRVHFKLVDATAGAKDNIKETDESKRQFVLDAEQPFELIDGEPDATGQSHPELHCRFYFRPATEADWVNSIKDKATAAAKKKAPTQEHLLDIAEELLLGANSSLPKQWKAALAQRYRKADGQLADYSTLKGQLNNYTKKNTFDYFIHKDLGGFLSRELDFYIKNELMQWADFSALKDNPARLAPMLSKLDVTRKLGEKIIAFLAQLENFQKKLWLKKKFVTETNYCITLDRVPEELYAAICENKAQLQEWIQLFAIDEIKADLTSPAFSDPLTLEFLKANQNLVLDTQFFDERFKAQLIASIDGFDEQCDGLLVNSENFQALNLLKVKYNESVNGIYIDPPYNTSASEIIYKNSYKHSSWLSFMNCRVTSSYNLLKKDGAFCLTIDDMELNRVKLLLDDIFHENNHLATVSIRNNPSGRSTLKGFSVNHEYGLFFQKSNNLKSVGRLPHSEKQLERYSLQDSVGFYEWENLRRNGPQSNQSDRPKQYYPLLVSKDNLVISVPKLEWIEELKKWELVDSVDEEKFFIVYPIHPDGSAKVWRYSLDNLINEPERFEAKWVSDVLELYRKKYANSEGVLPRTWWDKPKYSARDNGSRALVNLFNDLQVFDFPKAPGAVHDTLLVLGVDNKGIVLDYFAGSGTTGHAVINLNREDNGKRKYILTEMGNHFDTVLKPRLAKVAYASDWKNGKPVSRDTGISHCFKYIRLESYEDTLGNLRLERKQGQQSMFEQRTNDDARQAYVMNYMLDVETRGSQSLLNIQQFLDPTQYQLNVRSASGDETVPVNVDLLETFNYLLGLEVEHIAAPIYFDADVSQGEFGRWQAKVKRSDNGQWWFRTVYGTNRNGQQVLVVWRNLPSVIAGEEDGILLDNAVLDAVLVERLKIRLTESLDDEIDILYVNGDHNIHIPRDRQGQPMEQARVQLIEEAFHRLMFADTEAVH